MAVAAQEERIVNHGITPGCCPLIASHFNLTMELPHKAIVRGFSWTVIPITWRNRRSDVVGTVPRTVR